VWVTMETIAGPVFRFSTQRGARPHSRTDSTSLGSEPDRRTVRPTFHQTFQYTGSRIFWTDDHALCFAYRDHHEIRIESEFPSLQAQSRSGFPSRRTTFMIYYRNYPILRNLGKMIIKDRKYFGYFIANFTTPVILLVPHARKFFFSDTPNARRTLISRQQEIDSRQSDLLD